MKLGKQPETKWQKRAQEFRSKHIKCLEEKREKSENKGKKMSAFSGFMNYPRSMSCCTCGETIWEHKP